MKLYWKWLMKDYCCIDPPIHQWGGGNVREDSGEYPAVDGSGGMYQSSQRLRRRCWGDLLPCTVSMPCQCLLWWVGGHDGRWVGWGWLVEGVDFHVGGWVGVQVGGWGSDVFRSEDGGVGVQVRGRGSGCSGQRMELLFRLEDGGVCSGHHPSTWTHSPILQLEHTPPSSNLNTLPDHPTWTHSPILQPEHTPPSSNLNSHSILWREHSLPILWPEYPLPHPPWIGVGIQGHGWVGEWVFRVMDEWEWVFRVMDEWVWVFSVMDGWENGCSGSWMDGSRCSG